MSERVFLRAIELFENREFAKAANLAWQCLQDSPDAGQLWQLYGTCHCSMGNYLHAREALERATVLVPLHPLAQIALARSYARLGQDDLARTIYRYLVEDGACPTGLLPTVAVELNYLGAHELALSACETLVSRNPAHHQAHFGIAYYRSRLGAGPEELIPPLTLALGLAPNVLQYRLNLALALANAGRADKAHELVQQVDMETVHCPCWLRRLERIFEQVGDHAGARVCEELLAVRNAR